MNRIHLRSESGFYLHAKIIENDAKADGTAENIVEVYCMDDDYYPARSIDILVRVSGNALLKRNGQMVDHYYTDPYGLVRFSVINKVAEQVNVTSEVFREESTQQVLPINFIANSNVLKISQVANANRLFRLTGEPTTAWPGASFRIDTTGGSGNVEWNVIQSSAEVTIESDSKGSGIVTIHNRPRQICLIEGTDRVTKEKVSYNFQITNFVNIDATRRTIYQTESIYGNNILSPGAYKTLFTQWGSLRAYAPWNTISRSNYWTNDTGVFSTTYFNIANGTQEWEVNGNVLNVAYRVGSY
ncbi:hypothetical protein [Erwinia sp. ErVv1]|uniref:hypothetical protein n=1 Tax=Erwinia sp. ErVv1 TaxID=1603299 RepID=UPI00082A1AEF|nr:hypothetical protein [Erwinia sp. ErVv1]